MICANPEREDHEKLLKQIVGYRSKVILDESKNKRETKEGTWDCVPVFLRVSPRRL